MEKKYHIILSSNSPRRKELLAGLDIDFEIYVIKGINETYPQNIPVTSIAEYIATEKANLEAKKPYKEDEKDAVDKALEEMSAPYCTNINDGSYSKVCPVSQNLTALDLRGK